MLVSISGQRLQGGIHLLTNEFALPASPAGCQHAMLGTARIIAELQPSRLRKYVQPAILAAYTRALLDSLGNRVYVSMQGGVKTSATAAVARYVNGLPLPEPGAGGLCSDTSIGAVGFGFNTSSSCKIALTQAQLESYCG